jgi:hypothetical protein
LLPSGLVKRRSPTNRKTTVGTTDDTANTDKEEIAVPGVFTGGWPRKRLSTMVKPVPIRVIRVIRAIRGF